MPHFNLRMKIWLGFGPANRKKTDGTRETEAI